MKIHFKKSLKLNVIGIILFILFVCMISIYFVSVFSKKLYSEKLDYLSEVSTKSVDIINNKVNQSFTLLNSISGFISDNITYNLNDALEDLSTEVKNNDFKRMGIISLDGTAVTTDGYTYDFSDRKYFQDVLKNKNSISDVLTDKVDGKPINVFAVPIKKDEEIISVLFATLSTELFSQITSVESFDGDGFAYIIKQDGSPITYTEHESGLQEFDNLFDSLKHKTDKPELIDEFEKRVKNYETGNIRYKKDGVSRDVSYMPMGINDWYMISVVPTGKIFQSSDQLIQLILSSGALVFAAVIYLGILLIMSFRQNAEKLQTVAYTDIITGCSNWNKFTIDSEHLLKSNQQLKYAMVIFDIDHFKVINDLYGHQKGNELLQEIAKALTDITSKKETFARTSSDNFNILMQYETDSDIIKRITNLSEIISCMIEDYKISLSFGVYIISTDLINISAFSDRAAIAKQVVKGQTDMLYSFFDEETRKLILNENEIETSMQSALENHEFEMYLQPKFSFDTGKIVGAEALCRWNRPGKSMLFPNAFIPLFEKNGFIRKLDEYMFEQVCKELSRFTKFDKAGNFTISVNFSRAHLGSFSLSQKLVAMADKYGVSTSSIEIEITETTVFEDTGILVYIMNELKKEGFIISIDDFGSGYSSLNTLKDLPTDIIKMDKGFLDEATDNTKAQLIIKSLIEMTKALNLTTVAEGVETEKQVVFLKNSGCDIAQGYYYAKPMPICDFELLFEKINNS